MDRSETRNHRIGFLIDLAWWAAILAIVCLALKFIRVALPLLLAFAMAAAVRPVSLFLSRETRCVRGRDGERVLVRRKFRINSALAGVLSVLVLFAALGGLLVFLAVRASEALLALFSALPDFYETRLSPGFDALWERLIDWSERLDPAVAEALTASVPGLTSSLGSAVTAGSGYVVGALTSLASRLPGIALTAMVTVIAAVFIALDYDRIRSFLRKNIPARPLHYMMTVRNSFVDMLRRLVKSYVLLLLITSAENILGLWLIGVHEPVLLGLLIGAVDIFPVVGSGTVLLPWAAAEFVVGETLRGGLLLLLYGIITLARQILEPRIVGKQVGLRPIVTLGCMYVGHRLFGGVGLLALPIMAAIVQDLNSSGVIALFQHFPPPDEDGDHIHSEEIRA